MDRHHQVIFPSQLRSPVGAVATDGEQGDEMNGETEHGLNHATTLIDVTNPTPGSAVASCLSDCRKDRLEVRPLMRQCDDRILVEM